MIWKIIYKPNFSFLEKEVSSSTNQTQMAKHNQIGKAGEQLATELLIKKGYTIREINWRSGKYELDIVAQNHSCLIVAEVKTRSSDRFELPEEAITPTKIRKIVYATEAYIRQYDIRTDIQFDIITLIGNEQTGYRIEHIEDAFYAPL